MYQIDVQSASPAMPEPAAAGAAGFFTEGDAVSGQSPTVLPADFMNALMMELINLVVGAGLQPSKGDPTQVLQAVKALTGGSEVNLAARGHVKFRSGLIINWGNDAHGDNTGAQAVAFDLAFPNGVLVSVASNQAGGPPVAFHGTGNHSQAGMTVYSATSSNTASGAGTAFRWIAIGF